MTSLPPREPGAARAGGYVLALASVQVVIGGVIVALWHGAMAQERIARHLEGIERALTQRPPVG